MVRDDPFTYFISGASSGIGAEMARQLGARGASLALAARRLPQLEEVAASLPADSRVSVHPLDVTDAAAVAATFGQAIDIHQGLDVVVVNAGRGGGKKVGAGEPAENAAVITTNLLGALHQAEAAMEHFRQRGKGHLVLISSLAALRGLPGSAAAYSASKAGLTSLGESLRIETTGSDITVTTLHPGYIRTELSAHARFPYMTSLERGVAAIIALIDRRVAEAVVPRWPWAVAGLLLRHAPEWALRRLA